MNKGPERTCEMCQKPSAQLTNVTFEMGEVYAICPTCQQLDEAFEMLTINADRLFQDLKRQCGEASVAFFLKRLAASVGYEMDE